MSVGKVVYVSILAWKHKKISVLIWPPFRIFSIIIYYYYSKQCKKMIYFLIIN